MSKLEIIDSILHADFKDESGVLSEIDSRKAGKEKFEMTRQIVSGRDLSYSLYQYDSEKDIFPFFKSHGVTGLKKMCDYIFFIEEKEHFYVLLVELKRGIESAKKQLGCS